MRDLNFGEVKVSLQTGGVDLRLSSSESIDEAASRPADGLRKQSGKRKLKSEEDTLQDAVDTKRRRRTWEQWSVADKHIFFAALNLYGKDFDKIQDYFKNKMKNKQNVPLEFIKNKNQIRHFYYRTWHKITQYVIFEKALKASTKELFALINYGEIWKRIEGVMNRNILVKLNELVHKGSVTIKHKGKTFRVKTPVCPVLKRIHNKQNTGKQEKLPSRVTVELRPRHTSDWIKVHKMAQNPVVKVTLGVQRRLVSLLKHLKSKWKSRDLRLLETLQTRGGDGVVAPATLDQEWELVLHPEKGAEIKLPVIVPAPTITSSQISLQSMEEDECKEEQHASTSTAAKTKLKVKFGDEADTAAAAVVTAETNGNHNNAAATENCDSSSKGGGGPASSSTPRHDFNAMPDLMSDFKDGKASEQEDPEDFLQEDSDGENSQSPVPPADCNLYKDSESKDFTEDDKDGVQDREEGKDEIDGGGDKKKTVVDLKSNLSNLKGFDPSQGWSLANCGETTIGEMFLMLCQNNTTTFVLEYSWRREEADKKVSPPDDEATVDSKEDKDVKKSVSTACSGVLGKLVRLSSTSQQVKGRGRQNSLTLSSPNLRTSTASPVSPAAQTSRTSPVSRSGVGGLAAVGGRGVAKQLPLMSEAGEKSDNDQLAVPLEQDVEFRKPMAPGPAVKPAPLNSVFHQQVGQYFPKFSNRRGRQNRSRMNNKFVGRQVVKPIQTLALQPIQTINVAGAATPGSSAVAANRNIIISPSPIILSSAGLPTPTATLLPAANAAAGQPHLLPATATAASGRTTTLLLAPVQPSVAHANQQRPTPIVVTSSSTVTGLQPKSPPQISIPSPAMSPNPHLHQPDDDVVLSAGGLPTIVTVATTADQIANSLAAPSVVSLRPARTPSPTPSLSSLMDITFPESAPSTPQKSSSSSDQFLSAMMDDNSLLNTPMRVTSPPSSGVNLSEDISLTSWGLSFDSPLKQNSLLNHNEDSQTSIISTNSEVDRQLTAMMNENSIDFTSTFRQLAKHVTSDRENNQS